MRPVLPTLGRLVVASVFLAGVLVAVHVAEGVLERAGILRRW